MPERERSILGGYSATQASLGCPEGRLLPGRGVWGGSKPAPAPPADHRRCIAVIRVAVKRRIIPPGIMAPPSDPLLALHAGLRRSAALRLPLQRRRLLRRRILGGRIRQWRRDRSCCDHWILRRR